jgi:outer membrane protein assembly factor BamB
MRDPGPWLLAAALALLSPRVCAAQVHAPADPELATLDDRALVAAIEKEISTGDDRVLSDLESLFARVARHGPSADAKNSPGDALVEIAEEGTKVRLETLRATALRLALKLPKEQRRKLAESQAAALATERSRASAARALGETTGDAERFLERYPLVAGSASAAERLASEFFESGDDLGAASLDRLSRRLAVLASAQAPPPSPAARLRRALALLGAHDEDAASSELRRAAHGLDSKNPSDAALLRLVALAQKRVEAAAARRLAREARRPPDGCVADFLASFKFSRREQPQTPLGTAPVAAHVGHTVFASDGSRVLVVDADDLELEGRLPQEDDGVGPPGTGVPGTVTACGDLVLAPLFFESFLLPARRGTIDERARPRGGDEPMVRGGFFSLFVFDAPARRLLWCDGDAGIQAGASEDPPRGRPAGAEDLDETTWQRLALGHVVGKPLADGRRIYVPLVTASNEPQVWIAAYERATGEEQPLELVPRWRTFIVSSLQVGPANSQPLVPAANPRLALDPDGRIILQTDLGVVAALDARTGAIEWLVRLGDEDAIQARPPRRRSEDYGRLLVPSNDPPVVVAGRGSRPDTVVLASVEEKRFLGLSAEDGSVVWKASFTDAGFSNNGSESARVSALAPDVVALYGGSALAVVDGLTGKSLLGSPASAALDQGESPSGPLALGGASAFVLPLSSGRARTGRFSVRRGPPADPSLDDRETVPLEISLSLSEAFPLRAVGHPGAEAGERETIDGPAGVLCLEDRLVVVTGQAVNVYCWRKPDER